MKSQSTTFATFVALSIFCFGLGIGPSTGFTIPSGIRRVDVRRQVSNVNDSPAMDTASADDEGLDDEQLLRNTSKTQLVGLCEQFRLKTKGTKEELLQRLRDFAKEQEERERQLLLDRKKRVEQGSGDEREKIEIVDSEVPDTDDDEEEVFFYYPSVEADDKKNTSQNTSPKYTAPSVITAPPPPPLDENGERVVEIYSTTDMNDLTGVAAAQPGQAAVADPMTSNIGDPINAPWETNNPQKAESTSAELNAAKEAVSDLVQSLLAMTGAPAFQQDTDDLSFLGVIRQSSSFSSPEEFVEFDPAVVPTDMLTSASKNLRTGRGRVLQEVLREFELRAIGHDGAFGDDKKRGGGHYRQVSKIRSFLEGFRRAEVRRLARETTTLLLDKLVSEGIEGLDIALASMTRNSDDTNDESGELNDSLLDYLNDIIRQQEKKVEQMVNSVKKIAEFENAVADDVEDRLESLWTEETEEGEIIQTFDPNTPENKEILSEEFKKAEEETRKQPIIPKSAPEKLLLLLKLLGERIKTEAAFSHDEKARNLRVLAYSLNLRTDDQRKELFVKEFGSSVDRLDSFAELVSSSIEYGESTSHQLQPSKTGSLNVALLKRILTLAKEMKEKQSWRASGAKSDHLKP